LIKIVLSWPALTKLNLTNKPFKNMTVMIDTFEFITELEKSGLKEESAKVITKKFVEMEANFITRDELKAEKSDVIKDTKNSETSLKQEIQLAKQELKQEIQMVKQEFKQEIQIVKQEIQIVRQEIKMSEQRAITKLSGVMVILFSIATTLIGWMIQGGNLPH
jgi:hypothetical protein